MLAELWVAEEQLLVGEQPAWNALGVVEAVDAHQQPLRAGAKGVAILNHRRIAGELPPARGVHPHGEDAQSHVAPAPGMRSTSVQEPVVRSTDEEKCRTYAAVWNPMRSAPSRPSRICSRCGRIRNISEEGKGMWRKNPIRASGSRERTSAGTRMSW
jgi:hypothetical protein